MRAPHLLLFLFVQFVFSQSPEALADKLSTEGKFEEEIALRKEILKSISKSESEKINYQKFRLAFAQYEIAELDDDAYKFLTEGVALMRELKNISIKEKFDAELENFRFLISSGHLEEAFVSIALLYDMVESEDLPDRKDDVFFVMLERGKGLLYYREYNQALAVFEKSYEKAKDLYGRYSMETANVARQLSITYSYINNYPELLKYADEALDIFETIQPKDPFVLLQQYSGNYQSYKYYGDRKKMTEIYSKIKGYYEVNLHNPNFANGFHNDYPNLNPAKTIFYYIDLQEAHANADIRRAESIFAEFMKTVDPKVRYIQYEQNEIMKYYLETGSMFQKLGSKTNLEFYKKSKSYYLRGLEFCQKQDFTFGEMQALWMLSNLGTLYNQWDDAVFYSKKALEHKNIGFFNQAQTLLHNLAMAYVAKEDLDRAIPVLEEEYEFYHNDVSNAEFPSLSNLLESADVYMKASKIRDRQAMLKRAYENYYLASVIFSRLYRGGEFTDQLYKYVSKINNGLLSAAMELKAHDSEVVARIEINQSDYLWSNFLSNRTIPDAKSLALQNRLDSLEQIQQKLALKISKDTDGQSVKNLRSDLKKAEKEYEVVQNELKDYDNSFFQFSREDFDIKNIQEKLSSNDIIIKYVITEVSAYAYVTTPDDLILVRLPATGPEIKELLGHFLQKLKSLDSGYIADSKQLYSILIEPLQLPKKKNTIIVPDGFLANLPFEALISPEGTYLLSDFPISYSYSLKLFEIQRTIKERFTGNLAAFAPTYAAGINSELAQRNGGKIYDLKGAKDEVKKISAIFSSKLFLDDQATKENFIKNSGNYDILHLAMHASVDEEDPNLSHLIFEGEEPLYLNELYKLRIPAHLAVLSACSTGAGELKEGEGIQSLSRAFTYAGVKSTIMSLWPVPDKQTSEIMTEFYANLKKGKSKNEALQLAKELYIANATDESLKHPYYWAGFIVSGDTAALIPPKSKATPFLIIGIFGVLVAGGVILNRKRLKR
ncbi:MAG TPA: CHAT domain-containing tetratricopeptide repeat protein [Flavobacteriaceae bacterium]|nr:CHAT domain-containing tetratricopeptide repeat protein [Flavobacteriaceae bacterium]